MNNSNISIPKPVNEIILDYAPGSSERKSILDSYNNLYNKKSTVYLKINGEEVKGDITKTMSPPHDHKHILGKYHTANKDQVNQAIKSALDAKKKWIIGSLSSTGVIYIDEGASRALNNGKSLLAAGISKITGSFNKGENVLIVDQNENHLARGLASFNSKEIDKIKGKQSKEIEKILGYLSKSEIIHKDDMVML